MFMHMYTNFHWTLSSSFLLDTNCISKVLTNLCSYQLFIRVLFPYFLTNTRHYQSFKYCQSNGEKISCFKSHLRLVVTLLILPYVYGTFLLSFFVNCYRNTHTHTYVKYILLIHWLLISIMMSFEIQSKLLVMSKLENIFCLIWEVLCTPILVF